MSIADYLKQSELALAAYADLSPGIPVRDALVQGGSGMSFEQATRFSTQWTVVAQYNHTSEQYPVYDEVTGDLLRYDTTTNGLSVTVFQDNATGQKYLAIRGTDDMYDAATDLVSVGILGSTRFQAQYQSLRLKVQEWIGNGTLPAQFTVTGHSLGGFLATGLASEYAANVSHAYLYNSPGIGGIATATEIGQRLLSALNITASLPGPDRFSNIRADAGISPIAGLGLPVSPPINIAIENQFLSDVPNPPAARNHSQQTLTDALAVYAVYSALAPSLNEAQIAQLLKSASATNKGTLEGALDALRKTLLGANVTATAEGNRESLYANLYALQSSAEYRALQGSAAIRLTAVQSRGELVTKAKSDFGAFLAVKYLLPVAIEGAAGILSGVHGNLYTQWQADQAKRVVGGIDLDFTDEYLTDRATFLTWKNKLALEDADVSTTAYSKGGATDQWFRDNATNLTINLGSGGAPATKRRFIFDGDTGNTLSGGSKSDRLYGGGGDDVLYGFDQNDYLEGNAGDDQLQGSDGDDILVGGAGIDILEGGENNDTLIGGRGDDILNGGAGEDTYVINTGDGHDRIEDSGRNYIKYNGKVIAGSFVQSTPGGAYRFLGDDGWSMQFNSPGVLTLDENTSLTFDNFTSADAFEEANFGIDLIDAPAPVDYTRVIQGDREWQVFHAPAELEEGSSPLPSGGPLLPGDEWIVTLNHPVNPQNPAWANWRIEQSDAVLVDQYDYLGWTVKAYRLTSATWAYNQIDELGNYLTTEQVAAASDRLTGSAENDRILAGEGDDEVQAKAGADRVELGNGDDHAEGGEGSDTLVGGAGQDALFGDEGNEGDDAIIGGAGDNNYVQSSIDEQARESQSPEYGECAAANDCAWRFSA